MDCPPELLSMLAAFGVAAAADDGTDAPAIILASAAGRHRLSGPAYLAPFSVEGLDAAAGSVMAGLAACRGLAVAGHMLCLHGAAAVIGERGYLFLAPFATGKSSLMAELAARGASLLADDVVLLDVRGTSVTGLPLPPRLRRAFVDAATPPMKGWIAACSILDGPRYTYLSPRILQQGSHALTDVVLLNRLDDAAAEPMLEPASPGVIIPRLLWHNMSRHHPATAIAAMASGLAQHLRCSILHAADFAEAAERLLDGTLRTMSGSSHPPLASTRRDGIEIIRTDRGAVISDDQSGRIFEVNESAFVMFTLLQAFEGTEEVMDALRGLYADVPEGELAAQLAACTRQFADCGLIGFRAGAIAEG